MEKTNSAFFKGFDKNMQCLGFQYAEGETYTHDGPVELCDEGFHACELPLDTLTYYPLKNGNQYRRVELGGVSDETATDSKCVGKTITVGGKLNLFGLIQAHVEVVTEKVGKGECDAATTGYSAHAATTGDSAHAATTGRFAHAATTGDYAHAATTGDSAHAATTGERANAATTGRWANAVTTGYGAHAATTGDYANAATTGDFANAATTGDYANAATTGRFANAATTGYSAQIRSSVHDPDAVAAVLGEGAARGVKGSWIVLTERDDEWGLKEVRAVQVDGETVKENQYYRLSGGELVEVND